MILLTHEKDKNFHVFDTHRKMLRKLIGQGMTSENLQKIGF